MSDQVVEVVAPVVAPVVTREIQAFAEKVCEIAPTYKVRKTGSKTFRCLTIAEDENTNWKKGLVYFIARYSKGINLEFWLYGTKGSAALKEFNDEFSVLAINNEDLFKVKPLGHAVRLVCQIPDAMSDEDMEQAIKAFTEGIEPTATAVRAKIVVVSKKETKAKVKAEVPAPAPVAPVAPIDVPEIDLPTELTETPKVEEPKTKKTKKNK